VTVEDISRVIVWTRRVLRDVRTSTRHGPHGEPIEQEAILPIVDER
jgi:hypothetical protein